MKITRLSSLENHARLLWFGGLAVVVLSLAIFLDGTLSQTRGGDAPSYLILARSLAESFSLSDINVPGSPAHTQYPPLFPLLLAPVYMAFGYNFLLMKLMVAVSAVAAIFVVRAFFSSGDKLYGILVALLTGTNFYFLFYSNEILTEIPYTLLTFFILLYARKRESAQGAPYLMLILPSLLALAYMTRMIGVTLAAAAVLSVLLDGWRKEGALTGLKKAFMLGAAVLVPFVIWSLRESAGSQEVATYQSIFAQADYYSLDSGPASLSSLLERLSTNLGYYYDGVYKTILTFKTAKDYLPWPVFALIFCSVMAGFLKELVSKNEMKDFYFLFYMGLLIVWPVYGSGDARRYLVPMIPFIYHYFFAGLAITAGVLRGKARPKGAKLSVSMIAAPALLLALNAVDIGSRSMEGDFGNGLSRALKGRLFENVRSIGLDDIGAESFKSDVPCYYNYLAAASTLKGSLSMGDVVMARKAEIVYLLIDRPVVRFPYTSRAGLMEGFIREKGVSHVLIDGCYTETDRYVRKYFLSRPEDYKVLLSDGQGTAVLKLKILRHE